MAARFDIWVCQGRVCTAAGAEAIVSEVTRVLALPPEPGERQDSAGRARVLRGGCYGLCELGPNVVVRRHEGELPDVEVDRLTLTGAANERVYCGMGPELVERVVAAHLERDEDVPELLRAARERELPAKSPVAERLRQLRAARVPRAPP